MFSQETGNTDAFGQWADSHTLVSYEHASNGSWDHLEREIEDGDTLSSPIDDWQENVSTIFQCDIHLDVPNIMTYAFAVTDIDGKLVDCVAFGHDPQGLVNDVYDRTADPVGFDPSTCRILL